MSEFTLVKLLEAMKQAQAGAPPSQDADVKTPELPDSDLPSIELAVEKERILNMFDETLKKLELAACMPLLVREDGALLRPLLTREELQQVLAAARRGRGGQPEVDVKPWPLRPRHIAAPAPRHDPQLARALTPLFARPAVMDLVSNQLLHELSPEAGRLLESMRGLQADTAAALSVTASQQGQRERRLRGAWLRNQQALRDKESLDHSLEQQRRDLGFQLTGKNLLARSHQARIDRLRRQAVDEARTIVNDSEMNMSSTTRDSEYHQESLQSDIAELQKQLDELLAQHLAQEKEMQIRRLKMEAQLTGWLQNYDADISERQAELEEITANYETEKQQMAALQEAFEKQTLEHSRLMAEKKEEARRELEAMVNLLISNRAARCIQRNWRAYKQRKALRRKGRKKKKGSGKRTTKKK